MFGIISILEAININRLKLFFTRMSPFKIILFGFVGIIILGSILLSLPISSASGKATPFSTSYFTATSAVCVTGLIKVDTHNYWSLFGQIVIICLIQIGGMGFMTLCISALSVTKKKIGLASRELMQSSVSAPQLGGIVRMTRFILSGTLIVEAIGAFLLSFVMIPKFGILKGIWYSIFHSISAFCNAGFDLMGESGDFSSLTDFASNPYICFVIGALIVIGGLGFFVWRDLIDCKLKFSKYRLQTKVVLVISGLLIVIGAVLFYLTELRNPEFTSRNIPQQIGDSLFQSISARTAGFNTVDLSAITHSTMLVMIILMIVGGSPGSTAGGMKTTTFAVLVSSVVCTFKQKKNTEMFGRRLEDSVTRVAMCVFVMYITLALGVAVVISSVDDVPLMNALFESASAIATVGLTTGITPDLGLVSSVLLTLLMLFGRVGSLTMLLAFSNFKSKPQTQKPLEKIQIG